jgi:hypothetical protein
MPDGGTMTIRGNALAGDTLQIGKIDATAQVTLNLSHHAQATVVQAIESDVQTTVNVAGTDTLRFTSTFPSSPDVTVDLYPHARLTASFNLTFGNLTVNGAPGTQLVNDQATVLNGTHVVITPDVLGVGSFRVGNGQSLPGFIEFARSVAHGEAVTIGGDPARDTVGILQIDQPWAFHGAVTLQGTSQIDLVGLANADSYGYANDMLSIYAHNRVIDRLQVTNDSGLPGQPHDLVVSKSGGNVWVTEAGLNSPRLGSIQMPLHP